jgi:hypothetical protein
MARFVATIFLFALLGCTKEEFKKHNYHLVGKWKRVEVYVNPGNGGNWQADNSESPVTIEFTSDGKLISNSAFYSNFTGYEVKPENTIEFQPPMNSIPRAVYYSFNSATQLTLTFACIEGCGERFVRY